MLNDSSSLTVLVVIGLVGDYVFVWACCPLAADSKQVSQQVKEAEIEAAAKMEDVPTARASLGRVLSAWESYHEASSSVHAWLQQDTQSHFPSQTLEVHIRYLGSGCRLL